MAALKRESVRGGMVTMLSQGILIAIQLTSTVILARLLTPDAYGTIAMVLAITAFAGIFRDLGLSSAAIQKQALTHAQQSNLFWLNVAMGALLTVIVAVASPLVAWFYGKPELTPVTLALSATFLIASCGTQHGARLVREMRFGRRAVATISGSLITLAVAVTLASHGWSYWALVWGTLVGGTATTVLLFVLCPFRPGWFRMGAGIQDMLGFGANVTAFDTVNYFHRNLDNLLIGKFWGPETLGLYSRAYALLMFPINAIRGPILAVAFPAMSNLQNEPLKLKEYYVRMTGMLGLLSMPTCALLYLSSNEIIRITLGGSWKEVVPIFATLAFVGFIQPSAATRGTVLLALAKGDRYFRVGVFQAIFTSLGFIIGIRWGALGIAWSYVIAIYLTTPFMFKLAFKDTGLKFQDYLYAIRIPATASIASVGLIHFLILPILVNHSEIMRLIITSLSFLLAFSTIFALHRNGRREMRTVYGLIFSLK